MKCLMVLVWGFLLAQQTQGRTEDSNCRPTPSFCRGLGYRTSLQGAEGFDLQQMAQIVETGCSAEVAVLMCRVAAPECSAEPESRAKPCRTLCEKVRAECGAALREKALLWPPRLRCESLPESDCLQVRAAP